MEGEKNTNESQQQSEDAEMVVNAQSPESNKTDIPSITEEVKEQPVDETEPERNIYTLSCKVQKEEYKFFMEVLEGRNEKHSNGKPLTRDRNHLLRQCIRFTLNHRENMVFWIPPGISEVKIDT